MVFKSRVPAVLALLLAGLVVSPTPAAEPLAEPARWRLTAPAFRAEPAAGSLGQRLAERLAAAIARSRRDLTCVNDRELARLAAKQADRDATGAELAAAATRALAGDLDSETAAAAREVFAANYLLAGQVASIGAWAVVELWDLRGPDLVAAASVGGHSRGDLLMRVEQLAGLLLDELALEARLLPVGRGAGATDLTVSGGRFELDLGARHGLRAGPAIWLTSSLDRDATGRYRDVVAQGRLLTVGTRTSRGLVDAVLPGADLGSARYAVSSRPRPSSIDLASPRWVYQLPHLGQRYDIWWQFAEAGGGDLLLCVRPVQDVALALSLDGANLGGGQFVAGQVWTVPISDWQALTGPLVLRSDLGSATDELPIYPPRQRTEPTPP